jgi:hypothetical protein
MLAEPHKYASSGPSRGPQPIPLSQETQQKILNALAKEGEKLRAREEERRRRDPAYRPDAIELSNANLLEYDKYVDYYKVLEIDQFASAGEIKAAFKKLSLELHPDKVSQKAEAERAKAKERFLTMTAAHNILSDLATRRAYDTARDTLDARNESGLLDAGKCEKPPPTCVDCEVTLEQLYRGTRKQIRFERNEFANTRWAKKTYDEFNIKVNRGEYEGAAIWHRNQGDVGPFGRADLVFVVKQTPHDVFERLGDDVRAWPALLPSLLLSIATAAPPLLLTTPALYHPPPHCPCALFSLILSRVLLDPRRPKIAAISLSAHSSGGMIASAWRPRASSTVAGRRRSARPPRAPSSTARTKSATKWPPLATRSPRRSATTDRASGRRSSMAMACRCATERPKRHPTAYVAT